MAPTYTFLQKNWPRPFSIVGGVVSVDWSHPIPHPVAIADGLFTGGSQPHLIGGRDRETGRIVFPGPDDAERYEPVPLPRRGRLWSWTIQRFRPKSPPYIGPEEFEPFAVGYVELPGAVIVEARLANVDFHNLRIGMEMETILLPFTTDAAGNSLVTYAFQPTGGA